MINIRLATPEDNENLIKLTQSAPVKGPITIRIDRKPDFFHLVQLRGEGDVIVAIDNDQLVGCLTLNYKHLSIKGKTHKIGYVADMKVDPSRRGSIAAIKLLKYGKYLFGKNDVDIMYSIMGEGNDDVVALFDGRCGIPKFEFAGRFAAYQIFPSRFKPSNSKYKIRDANAEDFPDMIKLCNQHNKRYDFAPKISEDEIQKALKISSDSTATGIMVAENNGEIVATLSAFDGHYAKQNVIVDMPLSVRLLVKILHLLGPISPTPDFPSLNQPLRTLSIRHVGFAEGHILALRTLIQHIRYKAYHSKYTFVSIGLHEKDDLAKVLRGILNYKVYADCMISSLNGNQELLQKAMAGIPFKDFALV